MQFRVGNFNLRNLTLPNFQFYEQLQYSQSEYEDKTRWCTQQLINMSADIVSFQEVFHFEPLLKICEDSGLYPFSPICPGSDESEPRVALVSKYPIKEWEAIEFFPEEFQTDEFQTFRRPLISAIIELPNQERIRIFAVHLKSKRGLFLEGENLHDLHTLSRGIVRSLHLRSLEALSLRYYLSQNDHFPTVIVGDFNDTAHSVTTQIIAGSHPPFGTPEDIGQKIREAHFLNVHDFFQRKSLKDIHYTYIFNGMYENVDHIFVSKHFYGSQAKGTIKHFQSYTDHLIDRAFGAQPKETSDHGQIVATLQFGAEY